MPFGKKFDLVIYDNFFPNPYSGFRLDEFSYLLKNISKSKAVIEFENAYNFFGLGRQDMQQHINQFGNEFGNELKDKIHIPGKFHFIRTKILYTPFYYNILHLFKQLELFRIPFIVELYPGGGMAFNISEIDENLNNILHSKYCKSVIVNQVCLMNYLIDKKLCEREKIQLIYGLPIKKEKLEFNFSQKKRWPILKSNVDLCFVAAKYTAGGEDKGYDIFIEVAKKIAPSFNEVNFHVIGNFGPEDMDISSIAGKIHFYGKIPSEKLAVHLQNFDIIIAPNRANKVREGGFDGFPVGCCVEASLAGNVMITTDPLKENRFYESDEIIIVDPDIDSIVQRVEELILNPEKLYRIAEKGMIKTKELYSVQDQLESRLKLISKYN